MCIVHCSMHNYTWFVAQLKNTLNNDTLVLHGDPEVKADWSVLALGCHSAGCDNILKVIQLNSNLAKVGVH